jgi:hypothetical protein
VLWLSWFSNNTISVIIRVFAATIDGARSDNDDLFAVCSFETRKPSLLLFVWA